MTIAFICILLAGLLPYFWGVLSKFTAPGYNNNQPRIYLETLQGWRQRSHWAQLNSHETFPLFAAAVIVAHIAGVAPQPKIDLIAIVFIVLRLLYGICYIKDWATIRSLLWGLGLVCNISLFVISF